MLSLKTLVFKNIGRFVTEQTINFKDLDSLIQVDAQNLTTGGSSGSGKSTLFNALDWLLGLSDISTGVLQSRLTKEHISVTGIFDWDGKEVVVNRAKKLSVTVDGVETTGSSKISEELLDQIIGMPRPLFRSLLHKRQGEQGFFLNLGPAKTNDFLVDALGHSAIRSKIDHIDSKTKELAHTKIKFEGDLQALQASLEATKEALKSLGDNPSCAYSEEMLESYKNDYEASKKALETKQLEQKKEKEAFDLNRPSTDVPAFDRTTLGAIGDDVNKVDSEIKALQQAEKDRQAKVSQEMAALKLKANKEITDFKIKNNKEWSDLRAELQKLSQEVQARDKAKTEAVNIFVQLKKLKEGVCHTCEQVWVTETVKLEEQKLEEKLEKCKQVMDRAVEAAKELEEKTKRYAGLSDEADKAIAAMETELASGLSSFQEESKPRTSEKLEPLNEKLKELKALFQKEIEKEREYMRQQNAANKLVMDAFSAEQSCLTSKHEDEIAFLRKDLEEKRSKYELTASALKAYKEAVIRYRNTESTLKNRQEEVTSKVGHMTSKVSEVVSKLELTEEIKKCMKSYLSCSFDDALDSISDTATRILRSVPTMSNATIRLEGTKETNSGAIKEQVTAVLDNDGEFDIPIKSLSGGERSAVDLAVDLAVVSLIEETTGKGINLYIMDEPFQFLDTVNIEQLLEIIKSFSLSKTILVVDHNPIVKEMVNKKILVVRDGEESRVCCED